MEGLNRITLIGNLGQDPELRHTPSSSVLTLRLATTESFKNRDGERQQRTDWHTIKLWGKRGESLANIMRKGETICVEGRLQYEQWEDKQGQKRTTAVINATNVVLLGGRGQREDDGGRGQRGGGRQRDTGGGYESGGGFPSDNFGDDDIPF